MIKIIGVGDIMPGGLLHGSDSPFISDEVMAYLNQGDIRVGTLECAIGNSPDFIEEKMKRYGDVIYAPDEDLKRLKEMNINLVSLANNHFFDLKASGALHTIEMLDAMGIAHCGAGKNLQEAQKPVVFNINGKNIAFLAFCDYHSYMGYIPIATETTPGVNPMYDDYALEQIASAKQKYDYVVVIPHWGKEHRFNPLVWCYEIANKMLKVGADLILGGHTHRIQTVVNKNGKSIVYSMGNFCFPSRLIAPPLRATYYPKELISIKDLPITDRYPVVDTVTYKVWKPLAKYGMVVCASFDGNKTHTDYMLTLINDDNFIDFTNQKDNKVVDKNLKKYHFILKYLPYPLYVRVRDKVKQYVKK